MNSNSQYGFLALFALLFVSPIHGDSCVSCPKVDQSAYNVHLVPHSHMDLGWVKTVDQYFYGTNQKISDDNVQYIYDSVLQELAKNAERRFIVVETGFFTMWWNRRDDKTHRLFRTLLERGQIEFISGGIVMNDEAAAHYENIIDQMTFGLTKLNKLFGKCGNVETGWQIDPFGHSKQYAYILSKMGFNQLFYGRIDDQEKAFRRENKTLEFAWHLDHDTSINVGILNNLYMPPSGFCFDQQCRDDVIVDDVDSEEFNADRRAHDFIESIQNSSEFYATNHILLTMGADFQYQNALKQFSNLDTLIKFINDRNYTIEFGGKTLKVNLVYSTPTCYARNSFGSQKLTVNHADFFPYGFPNVHSYWSGYFTSRPSFKFLVRYVTNIYHSLSQMLAELGGTVDSLEKLRLKLAIAQHHDAITGTAKQFVNDNYIKMLTNAVADSFRWLGVYQGSDPVAYCPGLNVSICGETENLPTNGVPVTLYNSLGFNVTTYLKLPVREASGIEMIDENGSLMGSVILNLPDPIKKLPERKTKTKYELIVPVEVGAANYRSLRLRKANRVKAINPGLERNAMSGTTVVRGKNMKVTFEKGQLKAVTVGGSKYKLEQSFAYYVSFCNNTSQSSGAYAFRPDGDKHFAILKNVTEVKTAFFTEYRQEFSEGIFQNIRVFPTHPYIELDWIVGPIDVSNKKGREVVTIFESTIDSGDVFYTDSNGRDFLKRVRNQRDNWNLELHEPVAGNYYPINSRIGLRNGSMNLDILTDRSQGGTSLQPGSVELMMHRRCLCDDNFGVNEPLNEPGVDGKGLQVRGTYRVYFGNPVGRREVVEMNNPPLTVFSPVNADRRQLIDLGSLGGRVHILTLQNIGYNSLLLRLENIGTKTVTVQITKIILKKITTVTETDLSTLRELGKDRDVVEIGEGEIKTFIIKLAGTP